MPIPVTCWLWRPKRHKFLIAEWIIPQCNCCRRWHSIGTNVLSQHCKSKKPRSKTYGVYSKCGVWPSPATAMNLQPAVSDDGWRFRGLVVAAPGDGRTPAIRFADFENT